MRKRHAHHHPEQSFASRRLKIAVAGKGGVGKTTVAAALARVFAGNGFRVLAIDADPDANLRSALPMDNPDEQIVPLAANRDLLKQVVAPPGALPAGVFLLNPSVEGIPIPSSSWGMGQRLVVLGWTARGGQGCYCDETAALKRILHHLIAGPGEIIVIDGEPGLEHLSRGTVASADALLVVLEPGHRSVETAIKIRTLAVDLGIPLCLPVLSGARGEADRSEIQRQLGDWLLLGSLPFDPAITQADMEGIAPDFGPDYREEIEAIAGALLGMNLPSHGPAKFVPRPHVHIGPDGQPYTHTHNSDQPS
jgi:CO dehydrogenase maturation factor